MRRLFPSSATSAALKNLTKTAVNNAYDLGGAYIIPKSANAIRFDQLFASLRKVGLKVGQAELKKAVPLKRLVTTGSFDVVTDVTGSKAESCDAQPSNSNGGVRQSSYLVDGSVQPIVNASKH